MSYKNKTVFITGGGSGIGFETAKKLIDEGYFVCVYSTSIPNTKEIAKMAKNPQILFIKGDIKNRLQLISGIKKTLKKFGRIDVLINNAAIAENKEFIKTSKKNWKKIIDVNIGGTLNVTKEILKIMANQKSGMIINISSGAGIFGVENLSLYSLTKAALINFSQSLHNEVKKLGIDVFTITPGSTNTKMFKKCFPNQKPHHTTSQVADVILKSIKKEIIPDDKFIVDVFYHQG